MSTAYSVGRHAILHSYRDGKRCVLQRTISGVSRVAPTRTAEAVVVTMSRRRSEDAATLAATVVKSKPDAVTRDQVSGPGRKRRWRVVL